MTLTVTTQLDTTDPDDGLLSLREALVLANVSPDPDAIEFAAALAGKTLLLVQGELRIETDMSISAPLGGFTIDGGSQSRVISAYKAGSADPSVTLSGLTIQGGETAGVGGGIFSQGQLHLDQTTVTHNVSNGPAASGGGIYGDTVTLYRSTVSYNAVFHPGSIYDGGGITAADLTVSNSTIAGNRAGEPPSNGEQRGYGGGIAMRGDAALDVTNSTITGNYASFQGGGITGETARIANSLVLGNAAGRFDADFDGTVRSNGANVFGSVVEGWIRGDLPNVASRFVFAQTATIAGTDISAGVLGDNGGPAQTVALSDNFSNPAVGRAKPNGLTVDQRGEPRPSPDGLSDIGSFEFEPSHELLTGAPGRKLLQGSGDSEALLGLAHAEVLRGDRGHDLLDGGGGADRLLGGPGGDVLIGGGGPDRFIFRDAGHSAPALPDRILDFAQADGDRIVLQDLDGDLDRPGRQPLEFIGRERFTDSGQVMEQVIDGRTVIRVNLDDDLHAELRIALHDGIDLTRADFVL